jgi:hypothetical protein
MPMRLAIVGVHRAPLDADQIQLPVSHTALGDEQVGEAAYGIYSPLQDQTLDAVLMIEMRVRGRDGQLVMFVLQAR